MIKLVNIHKVYESEGVGFLAVKDVNLDFLSNDFVCILGKSGSGKTTLLNIIGGLDKASAGHMVVDNVLTTKFSDQQWDYFRNYKIGFIFQNYSLIEHLSVLDNVMLGVRLQGVKKEEARTRSLDLLEKVGVKDQAYKLPKHLSGGQRQRVAIARALVNDPEVILADEPTGALDKKTSKEVMDLLKELSKDKLVLMVTHSRRLANEYADRIIELKDGMVVYDSKPEATEKVKIKKSERLVTTFKLGDKIKHALKNIRMKKGRTFLTSLGLAIGVTGYILINSLSNGLKSNIEHQQVAFDNKPDFEVFLEGDYATEEKIEETIRRLLQDPDVKAVNYDRGMPLQIIGMDGDELSGTLNQNVKYPYVTEEEQRYLGKVYSGGRFPVSDNEIVITQAFAEQLYDFSSLDKLWEKLNGVKLEVVTDYYFSPFAVEKLANDACNYYPFVDETTVPEGYDESVQGPFADHLTTQKDLFNQLLIQDAMVFDFELNTPVETTPKNILICENYYKLPLEPGEIKETKEFTIVGILESGHVSDSLITETAYFDLFKLPNYQVDEKMNIFYRTKFNVFLTDGLSDDAAFDFQLRYRNDYEVQPPFDFGFDLPLYNIAIDLVGFIVSVIMFVSVLTAGVMLLMVLFISVMERSREIGILRSLGATKNDILSIFTVESGVIGFFASIIGIVLSILLTFAGNIFIRYQYATQLEEMFNRTDINLLMLKPTYCIMAIIVCIPFAMLFGLIPAIKASRKTPINALKKLK